MSGQETFPYLVSRNALPSTPIGAANGPDAFKFDNIIETFTINTLRNYKRLAQKSVLVNINLTGLPQFPSDVCHWI